MAGPAVIVALLTLGVTASRPPSPPAPSAASESAPPFWSGLKMAFTTPAFVVLALTLGGGVGLFNSLYNNLQPMLCVKGYSDVRTVDSLSCSDVKLSHHVLSLKLDFGQAGKRVGG